jgi:uncharacterized protein YukE
MNFLIGAIGANLTMGLVTGVSAMATNIYSLTSTISHNISNGEDDIKKLIKEADLDVKIKTILCVLSEIKINISSPYTLHFSVQEIKNAIKDIETELEQIQYRITYNNSLFIGSAFRKYKFHNNYDRLETLIKTLDKRYKMLFDILKIENTMAQNKDITNYLTSSTLDKKLISSTDIIHNSIEFID